MIAGVLAGLVSAVGFGASDFFSTRLSRSVGKFLALAWVMGVAAIVSGAYFFLFDTSLPAIISFNAVLLFLCAVLLNLAAWLLFFSALQKGLLSIASPVSALWALVTLALSFVFLGERLAALQLFAVLLAPVGVFLSSVSPSAGKRVFGEVAGLPEALGAAFFWGIGIFLWKVLSFSFASASLIAFLDFSATFVLVVVASVFLKKQLFFPPKQLAPSVFAAGFLNSIGGVALFWGLSTDLASLVAPVAALFPVVSVVLAFVFLKERLALSQLAGVCLVVAAIVLASM